MFQETAFSDESETWTRYLHSNEYVRQSTEYHHKKGKRKRVVERKATDSETTLETTKETGKKRKKQKQNRNFSLDLPMNIVVSSVKSLAQDDAISSAVNVL